MAGQGLLNLAELNVQMNLQSGVERWTISLTTALTDAEIRKINAATKWTSNTKESSGADTISVSDDGLTLTLIKNVASTGPLGQNALNDALIAINYASHTDAAGANVAAANAETIVTAGDHAAATKSYVVATV
jgi:hypothetical protein